MPARCILLAGAPEASRLQWDADQLTAEFNTPVKRFLTGAAAPAPAPSTCEPTPTYVPSKWRVLSFPNPPSETEPPSEADDPQTQFLPFHNGTQVVERDHRDFLEHSLALLGQLESSQVAGPEETPLFLSTHSFATTDTSLATGSDPSSQSPAKVPLMVNLGSTTSIRGEITDLRRIPPADHITKIQPQTMTINVIAAVISVSPARTVSLRRQCREMDIIEVLLGDETKAGFSISFWLTPIDTQARKGAPDDLRSAVERLRSGDVVMVQNVALSVWKGCVYGQSLARRMFRRTATAVTVLGHEVEPIMLLPKEVLGKVGRVRRWADDFVVGGGKGNVSGSDVGLEPLPADTQEQDTVWG